jgi:hypothetical protein
MARIMAAAMMSSRVTTNGSHPRIAAGYRRPEAARIVTKMRA